MDKVGKVFKLKNNGLFQVVEKGHLSWRIAKLNDLCPVEGWIGTNELKYWIDSGQCSEQE